MQDFLYGPRGEQDVLGFQSDIFPPEVCEQVDADTTGEKLLDCLLLYIIQGRLTSLSLQPMGEYAAITAKKGESRREIGQMRLTHYPDLILRIRKLSRINGSPDISSRGVIAFNYKGERIPFQIALLRGAGGDYVTFRVMVRDSFPASFQEMGLNEGAIATLNEIASARKGLILWASVDHRELSSFIDMYLDEIDTTCRQVLLVGNGLGRGKKRIPRIPVPAREQLETAALIAAVVEHDPDLMVIEEIADIKTLAAALAAAMRNSVVMAGVSLEGMPELLDQILAMRRKHPFFAANLLGIGCLKGVLTLCPECRERYAPTPRELEALGLSQLSDGYYRPKGCGQCNYTGFERKRFLLELVAIDDAIRNKLGTVADKEELLGFLDSVGYQDVTRQGEELLQRGEISPEEFSAALKA
jgi:type II secretory ATPase GspE/PulE/Tfp pilus assembly ATPase PilB-like protein